MADTPNNPATPEGRADNPQAATPRDVLPPQSSKHLPNTDPIAPADQFESPYEQNVHQTDPHRDLAPEEDDEFFNEYRTAGENWDLHDLHAPGAATPTTSAPKKASEFQPIPWWTVGAGLLLLWGGYYMGANSGGLQGDVFIEEANYKPIASGPPVDPKSPEAMAAAGQKIFTVNCVQCHQSSGLGVAGQFPPLVASEWVIGDAPKRLQQILLHGIQGTIHVKGGVYNNAMPAWNVTLTDKQIAQVLTYVRTKLGGNSAGPISEEQMTAARKLTPDHNDPWTEAELLAIPAGPIDGGAPAAPTAGSAPAGANPPNSAEGAAKPAAAPLGQGPATPAPSPAP